VRALGVFAAMRCETATAPRCRCRCNGLLHGAKRFTARAELRDLSPDDPHNPRRRARRGPPEQMLLFEGASAPGG